MSDSSEHRIAPDSACRADRSGRPASPCVSLCTLDDADRCLGCGRTLEQIARWSLMSPAEQWAVIDELARRAAVNMNQDA